MSTALIRKMTADDVSAVVAVDGAFAAVSSVEYQGMGECASEWLPTAVDSKEWDFFVAEVAGQVVGYGATLDLGLEPCDFCFADVADTLYLVYMAVQSEHRGRGVGAQLLEHAESIARGRGRSRMLVDVAADNPQLNWYEKREFTEIGAQKYMMRRLGPT